MCGFLMGKREEKQQDISKMQCWECKQCGYQVGGENAKKLCICPCAQKTVLFDGKNGGQFAGRCCWRVAGTLCEGTVQGRYAKKIDSCRNCDFYKRVQAEEGEAFEE